MSKTNEITRIHDFFYNINDNLNGIIDRVEFIPKQISDNVFISGMRLLTANTIELHVKTIRGFDPNIVPIEQIARMTPESESWVEAQTFSEDTLKLVVNDFIRQVDTFTEYHMLLNKWFETTIPNLKKTNFEVILFNSKKAAYKEVMRIKKTYESFICSYKVLDKYGRMTTFKTFQNLTKVNNHATTTNTTTLTLPYKTTQEKIMTDLELVTCNINSI